MDDVTIVTETEVEDTPVIHELGKSVVGGLAAFAAHKLADKVYDGALRAYRARKSS